MLKIPEKIDLNNYKILRIIGEGAFGTVKLAQNRTTNKFVAIKIMIKTQVIKNHQTDHIYNEISI
jgi:serine/threonine protein kinase